MQKLKSKSTTAIALVLMFAVAFSLLALPTANAQLTKATYALIGAVPNPVGVGQETLILTGITDATVWPQPGWEGLWVTIEKPDGTTEKIENIRTDTTGMTGVVYVPKMAGTYYLQTHFPEQVLKYTDPARPWPGGTVFKASTSEKYALIVTEEPRQYHPGFPLPAEYWTRPIDAQFREWAPLAGNWLNIISYNQRLPPANDDAPETAHILWAQQLAEGGLVGDADLNAVNIDAIAYEHGDAYEGKWANPVIMNGILFYTRHNPYYAMPDFNSVAVEQTTVAVDIHTGQKLWEKVLGDNERVAFGQIFYWKTMNMYGAFSYLWTTVGTTWKAYDPFTGRWEYSISGVLTGTNHVGPNGEILRYTIDLTNGWLVRWNSTRVVHQTYWDYYKSRPADAPQADYLSGRWRPHGITFNYTKGIQWNVTIPKGLPGAIKAILGEDRILGSNTNWSGGNQQPRPVFWAISIKPGDAGRLLFNVSWPLPAPDVHVDIPGSLPVSLEDKVFVVGVKEQRVYYGFDLDTGRQIWGPTSPPEPILNAFTNLYMAPWGQSVIKYGKLYTAGMAGVVNAYDVKTGKHLWQYNITDPYTEQLFSSEWPAPINFIVDGKIYLFHQEHSANTPLPRGAPAVCLNATTGEEIWRINGLRLGTRWGGQPVIGDSIIVGFSSYDNRIIAIGKGPSAITVSAPEIGVPLGKSVLVKGIVTDISPGTKDAAITMRFPNGVPAVADEHMSEWMLYVYQQHPRPTNVKGVEVVVSVLDPNGNCYEVGRTTSDDKGLYSVVFEPPVPGKYTIIASFGGSKSYWPSSAETALYVEEAPATTPMPTPAPQAPVETYFAVSTIAIIIAIAIIGVLILRKKA